MLYDPGPIKAVGLLVFYLVLGSMLPKGTKALGILFYRWTSKLYDPGPTAALILVLAGNFSPLKTNAIKFIIDSVNTTDKTSS